MFSPWLSKSLPSSVIGEKRDTIAMCKMPSQEPPIPEAPNLVPVVQNMRVISHTRSRVESLVWARRKTV